jgi:hypothetical protein
MTGESVRAIRAGTKTQTRRVLKPQPPEGARYTGVHYASYEANSWFFSSPSGARKIRQRFDDEDLLWVRETWKPHSTFARVRPRDIPPSTIFYAADDAYAPSNTPWRSSIHMPRWASRLTLAVTDLRVQRLQDISEEDAVAEGCSAFGPAPGDPHDGVPIGGAVEAYAALWDSLHGRGAWDANPWVAAVSFAVEPRGGDHGT